MRTLPCTTLRTRVGTTTNATPARKKKLDEKGNILIVDDDPGTCRSLTLVFGKKGYETETAGTGQEAIEKAQQRFFNLTLLDIKLPDMEGVELIASLKEMHPDMVVIMVTAYASLENAVRALNEGASAYLTKPLDMDKVLTIVKEALEKQHLVKENKRLYEAAQKELAKRKQGEEKLKQYAVKLQELIKEIIQAIVLTTEMRDPYTSGHQRRVTQLACAIAREMGLNNKMMEEIRVAGTLHDIGKMYVPSEILTKPGRLTEPEFNMIKTHPEAGYNILKMIEFPWPVAPVVLQHHERIDGSGYPSGLSAKDIRPEARILAVADVVEAMSSHRPYRPARGIDKALEEVSQNRGILYDPAVVDTCLKLFAEERFKFESPLDEVGSN